LRPRVSALFLGVAILCVLVAGCTKNTSPPVISGSAVDGNSLTAKPGSWTGNGAISYAYQWQRCDSSGANCQNVGANSTTYVLGHSDVGSTIEVVVTATDSDGPKGATSATSAPTSVVAPAPPVNTASPSISGTSRAGQTLSADPGTWTGTPPISFTYQWRRCDTVGGSCQDVTGNGSQYALTTADVGSTIRVSVAASNQGGSAAALSGPTAVIGAAQDPTVVAAGDIACRPGDTHNACRQTQTETLAASQNPDDVLVLGDNQYDSGLLSEYQGAGAYGATWGVFNPIVHPVPGNHEYGTPGAAGYFQYFGQAIANPGGTNGYYSFNVGSWHIVALNSNCTNSGCTNDPLPGGTTSAQTSWLQSDLAANRSACTLAMWHHPLFSSGWTQGSPGVAPLWNALYAAGADVVLDGHDHLYERYAPAGLNGSAAADGIREFVVGTGGESLNGLGSGGATPHLDASDSSDFGVLKLALRASSYDWTFLSTSGKTIDTGSASCHGRSTASASAAANSAARLRAAADIRSLISRQPRLAFAVRPLTSSLKAVIRGGLPMAVYCSRKCDVSVQVSLRQGRRLQRIATFLETDEQIPRPYSRILLRLPDRLIRSRTAVRLLLRFSALDAASHHRVAFERLLLRR
jgi:acid phosphatase type 7